jgi:hypothetical protein
MESKDDVFLQNGSRKNKFSPTLPQILIGIFLGVIVLVIIIYLMNYYRGRRDTPSDGQEDQKAIADEQLREIEGAENVTKIALVGKEYLFESDLNYYAFLNSVDVDELDRNDAIDDLINQSILLQTAELEGWIVLSTDAFNNPFKDFEKMGNLLIEAADDFESGYREGTYVEVINVWFYNVFPGTYAEEYGLEAAQQLAYEKIQEAYNLVVNQGKSMSEASDILIADTELGELNESYETTTYFETIYPYEINSIDDLRDDSEFGMDGLFEFLQNAQMGDVSQIYLEKDNPGGDSPVIDAYYSFCKLNDKKGGFLTVEELVESKKQDFLVEIY